MSRSPKPVKTFEGSKTPGKPTRMIRRTGDVVVSTVVIDLGGPDRDEIAHSNQQIARKLAALHRQEAVAPRTARKALPRKSSTARSV